MPEENRVVADRKELMKELAEQRKKELGAESAESFPEIDEDGNPVPEKTVDQEAEEKGEDEPSLEEAGAAASAAAEEDETPDPTSSGSPSPEPAAAPAFDPEAEYELTVEGQKIKVKGSQILEKGRATLQKETAAEYKLQLASELLEEAKRRTALPPGGHQPAPERPDPKPPTDEVDDTKLAELIQFGTKEQAAAAVRQLRESGRAVDPEQVMNFVMGNIGPMVAAQIEFRNAAEMVKRDYPDLMGNDYLRRLFYVEENRRRAPKSEGGEGDSRSPSELYRSIGDDLRKAFNMKAPVTKAPATPTRTLADKQEAKAKAPVVPSPAQARMEGKQPARAPTHAELIDKVRAARHQRPLNS